MMAEIPFRPLAGSVLPSQDSTLVLSHRMTEQTKPFPYSELVNSKAFRDDMYFVVLAKELPASQYAGLDAKFSLKTSTS
jgi:hypothetical protein